MKKKELIIVILFILLGIILFIDKIFSRDQKIEDSIPVYESDVVCHLDGVDNFEGIIQDYSLRAYLTIQDDLVTKAILVSVSAGDNLYAASSYVEDYNAIKGINAQVSFKGENLVTEVEYDYEMIDLEEVRDKLGYLLIDDSIFKRATSLPVSLEEYKEYEIQDYICD